MGLFGKKDKNSRRLGSRTNTTQSVSVPAEANLIDYAPAAHTLSISRMCKVFGTSQQNGLTKNEAHRRLETYGENLLKGDTGVSWYKVLIGQISNALTLVLVAALALSFGVGDFVEGGVIAAVIVLNTTVGFFQEYRAEKTMDSLRQLSSPTALVVRNGESITVPAKDVVPGDVVMITTGDVVPADLRLVSVSNLELSEQLLTGESVPVAKTIETFGTSKEDLPIGDRINLCYASTVVTKGRGTGVAVGTGMNTQIGRIAAAMGGKTNRKQEQPRRVLRAYDRVMTWLGLRTGTPLQIKLSKLAYILFGCAILLAIIVFSVAKFNVDNEVAIYAIATAIAIIPESLIAVLTLTMAVGTRRMAKQSVIVRKLDALENLGGVTDICSDKTGTLTLGKMSVKKMWVAPDIELVAEQGNDAIDPTGDVTRGEKGEKVEPSTLDEGIARAVRIAALCNVANIHKNLKGEWKATGDPTEIALQVFAHKLGLGKPTLASDYTGDDENGDEEDNGISVGGQVIEKVRFGDREDHTPKRFKLIVEFPFSSEVKRMSTIYADKEDEKHAVAFIKGAVERILDASNSHISTTNADYHPEPLTKDIRQDILNKAEELASQGLRVIAVGQRFMDINSAKDITREQTEKDFTFLGLFGIFDPPRPETLGAVRACKQAGIVVHMLTGDHVTTARAIAEAVEIIGPNSPPSAVMTATEFDKLSDAEIDALPELPLVIARCAPETKVRMIHAGKRRGKHLSMSGDGVNDSPALKLAPVGVAMGLAGSDVAKDASDLVLTDDNFDSIRAAVSEGRRLFKNIQRFILHLLTTNVAEVILLIIGLAFQDENGKSVFPLSPLGVLWVNMITSSPPAFGLGLEPAEANLMKMPPHSTKDGAFTWPVIVDTFSYGIAMGVTNLVNFILVVYAAGNDSLGVDCNKHTGADCDNVFRARSTVFVTLIFQILLYAFELKTFDRSMFSINPGVPFYKDLWANKVLFWAVIAGMASVVLPVYIPGFNTRVFYQKGITWEWGLVIGMSIVFIIWCEFWKFIRKPIYKAAGWWSEAIVVGAPISDSEKAV